jgi:hypothetical protein
MRALLDSQGFAREDVIRFAALLLEGVIGEVRVKEGPPSDPPVPPRRPQPR